MRCKVCGTEYREGSLYCGTCGVRLAEENDQDQIPVPGDLEGEIPQGKQPKPDRGHKTAYPKMAPQNPVSQKDIPQNCISKNKEQKIALRNNWYCSSCDYCGGCDSFCSKKPGGRRQKL